MGEKVNKIGLPYSYKPASLRCFTRVDDKARVIGVAFNAPDGSVIRLCLPISDAVDMAAGIFNSLGAYLTRVQSDSSSGIPSVSVSVPHDVENV